VKIAPEHNPVVSETQGCVLFHPLADGSSRCGYRDRAWWRVEARRLGSDWPGILRLQADAVDAWRARHDPEFGRAAA
jgi:hypothetical protein